MNTIPLRYRLATATETKMRQGTKEFSLANDHVGEESYNL